MQLVNIIHKDTDVLEYLYLSSFFKTFGYLVYNSVNYVKPEIKLNKNMFDDKNVGNIVITNDADILNKEAGLSNHLQCIFVSKFRVSGSVSNDKIIKFPQSVYDNNGECTKLFKSIFLKWKDMKIISETDPVWKELEEMIEMFIDCNLIKNYYIPFMVTQNYDKKKTKISILSQKAKKYAHKISLDKNGFCSFAAVKLQYLTNKLCSSINDFIEFDWNHLIDYIQVLINNKSVSPQQSNILSALILDDSRRSLDLTIEFYKKGLNAYTYYGFYKLARIYEYRLNDKIYARKYLNVSIQSNRNYFRNYYKIGCYYDECYDYNKALFYYNETIKVIEGTIKGNYWNPLEMMYYIKTCGRIMALSRYFENNDLIGNYGFKVKELVTFQQFTNNEFIENLCLFLKMPNNSEIKFKETIYNELYSLAEIHVKRFCYYDFIKDEIEKYHKKQEEENKICIKKP